MRWKPTYVVSATIFKNIVVGVRTIVRHFLESTTRDRYVSILFFNPYRFRACFYSEMEMEQRILIWTKKWRKCSLCPETRNSIFLSSRATSRKRKEEDCSTNGKRTTVSWEKRLRFPVPGGGRDDRKLNSRRTRSRESRLLRKRV